MSKKKKIVAVSGGFDPLHIGHIRLFEAARMLGDELVVILNNDNWLKKKKGSVFMPQKERKEIVEAIWCVDRVILSEHKKNDKDRTVSRELKKLKPDIFANGGDRNKADAENPDSSLYKDIQLCNKLGTEIIFNVGKGGKVQSSSWLLDKHSKDKSSAKKHILKFRAKDGRNFGFVRSGKKKIETRAATEKYRKIKRGDILRFVCGAERFEKKVLDVHIFKSIDGLLKKYNLKDINPTFSSKKDLEKMYAGFPNYKEKLKKYGIIAFKLK